MDDANQPAEGAAPPAGLNAAPADLADPDAPPTRAPAPSRAELAAAYAFRRLSQLIDTSFHIAGLAVWPPILRRAGFQDVVRLIRKPAIAEFINATAAKRTKNIEAAFQAQVVAIDNIIALEAAANPPRVLPSVEDGLADEFISVCLHIKDEQNTFISERGAAMTAFYAIDNHAPVEHRDQQPSNAATRLTNPLSSKTKFDRNAMGVLLENFRAGNGRNLLACKTPHFALVKKCFTATHGLWPTMMRRMEAEQRYKDGSIILEISPRHGYRDNNPPVLKLLAEYKRIFNTATLVFSFPVGHRDESQRSHPYFKVVPHIDVPCGFLQSSHENLALCASAFVTQTLINRFESAAVNADSLPPAQLVEQRIDDVIDTVNQYLATDGATFTAAITYTMRHPDLFVFRSAIQPRSAFVIKTFYPSDDNTDADSDSDSGRAIKPRRRERDTKKGARAR